MVVATNEPTSVMSDHAPESPDSAEENEAEDSEQPSRQQPTPVFISYVMPHVDHFHTSVPYVSEENDDCCCCNCQSNLFSTLCFCGDDGPNDVPESCFSCDNCNCDIPE